MNYRTVYHYVIWSGYKPTKRLKASRPALLDKQKYPRIKLNNLTQYEMQQYNSFYTYLQIHKWHFKARLYKFTLWKQGISCFFNKNMTNYIAVQQVSVFTLVGKHVFSF